MGSVQGKSNWDTTGLCLNIYLSVALSLLKFFCVQERSLKQLIQANVMERHSVKRMERKIKEQIVNALQ